MSSIGFGIPDRIDGPPPLAPLFGLIQAAAAQAAGVRIVPDTDANGIDRWMNGVQVFPYPPDVGDVFDPCAVGSPAFEKGFGTNPENPQFGAMTIWLAVTCTAYKVWNQEEYKARAVASFSAVEGASVAHEFMTGARMPAMPHLADGNGIFPNFDTATSAIDGLAYLEQAIANTYRQGLIHVSPQLAASLMGRGFALADKTGVIRTINGTVVIPDAGYASGSTPTGHAAPASPTEEWIYATGPVDIRRSEVFVSPEQVAQAVDRGSGGASNGTPNSITYRVERYYLVDWDTVLQAAVLVDRCLDTCQTD